MNILDGEYSHQPHCAIWASALSLLVLRVFTDYPDFTLSLNDFALIADRFYRRSYFHFLPPLSAKNLPGPKTDRHIF